MKNSSDDEFQNMLNNDQYSIRSQKDKRILKQHKKKWIQDHILSKLTEKRMNPIQVYTSIFIILFSCETVQISLTRLTLLKNKIYSSFQKKHICMELSKSYSESFSKLTDLVLRLTNLSEYSIYQFTKEECWKKITFLKHKVIDIQKKNYKKKIKLIEKKKVKNIKKNRSQFKKNNEQTNKKKKLFKNFYQYRWFNKKKIYGKFKAYQLKIWLEAGFFKNGILLRKIGEVVWKNSNRINIDFVFNTLFSN